MTKKQVIECEGQSCNLFYVDIHKTSKIYRLKYFPKYIWGMFKLTKSLKQTYIWSKYYLTHL